MTLIKGDLFANIMKQSTPADIIINYLSTQVAPSDGCIQFYDIQVYITGRLIVPYVIFRGCDLNQPALKVTNPFFLKTSTVADNKRQ